MNAYDMGAVQNLWSAVFNQAIRDCYQFDLGAIRYIFHDEDSRRVAESAGYEIDYVRFRMSIVIGLLARKIARNKQPKFSKDSKKVVWVKPGNKKRKKAIEFLSSDLYKELQFIATKKQYLLDADEAVIERAISVANAEKYDINPE